MHAPGSEPASESGISLAHTQRPSLDNSVPANASSADTVRLSCGQTTVLDATENSYFDLVKEPAVSPGLLSIHSNDGSPSMANPLVHTALTALQYLPVPVLVLNSHKTGVLANDAFARLLDIELPVLADDGETLLSVTDLVEGRTMSDLGIDLVQNGSTILISWEVGAGDHSFFFFFGNRWRPSTNANTV